MLEGINNAERRPQYPPVSKCLVDISFYQYTTARQYDICMFIFSINACSVISQTGKLD